MITRMTKTRLSLFYLASYLMLGGVGLLVVPHWTLKVLQSNRDYGDIFPRLAGMLMSGLGLSIFGMIRARSTEQYSATFFIRAYFIVCLVTFYTMTRDPLFVVLVGIVGLGLVLTFTSYLLDRRVRNEQLPPVSEKGSRAGSDDRRPPQQGTPIVDTRV